MSRSRFFLRSFCLKTFSRSMLTFPVVIAGLLLSYGTFAMTEDECKSKEKGTCIEIKTGSSGDEACGDDYSYRGRCDNLGGAFSPHACCVSGGVTKSACESSSGKCQSADCGTGYKSAGKCLASDGGGTCCIPNGATKESECLCDGKPGQCVEEALCPTGTHHFGICKGASWGVSAKCCIPDSCKPTPVGASGPSPAAGLNYVPLENIPGFEGQGGDFPTYLKNLYLFALWIVALSALFMLTVGGFLYLSSAGNTHLIGNAKKTIYASLIGLVLALLSWLLLDTINSDLTNLKLSGLSISGSGTGGSGGGGGPSNPPVGGSAGKVLEEAYKMVALSDQKKCEYSQSTPRNGCDQSQSHPHTDCSDFTVSAYKRAGCSSPPDGTANMIGVAEEIGDKSTLKAGDAIVYNHGAGHVVICENDGCSTYTAAASTKSDLVRGRDSGHMFREAGLKVLRVSKYCKDS